MSSTNSNAVPSPPASNPLLIYFCASIRGEEVSKPFLNKLMNHLKTGHGQVLTEHIGYDKCEVADQTNEGIYNRDVAWLKQSDIVIAECSAASLGVGYELAYAEMLKKPILVLYRWPRADSKHISGMIAGCPYPDMVVKYYKDEDEAYKLMDEWIAEWKAKTNRAPPSNNSARLTTMLGLKYPLICPPMAGRCGARMAIAVARAGAFGFIAAGNGRDIEWIRSQLQQIAAAQAESSEPLAWGVGFMNYCLEQRPEALDLVLAHRPLPLAIWLSFGSGQKFASKARQAGVRYIISQVQHLDTAIESAAYSDILVLQGAEAGGHGASQWSRQQLFDQVRTAQSDGRIAPNIPIILAGGFGSTESIIDGISQPGVAGLVLGTRFLACHEIEGPSVAKEMAIQARGTDTCRSDVFDLLAIPGVWPSPYDGRAILHPHAEKWLPHIDQLRVDPSKPSAEFKSDGGMNVWAGTGVDAVTKEESAAEVVETIGKAMEEGINKRIQQQQQ